MRTECCLGLIVAGCLSKKLDVWADPLLTATVVLTESHNSSLDACQLRICKSVIARREFSKTRFASSAVRRVYQHARHKFDECRHVARLGVFG
jgi:hypothetical protein